MMIIIFLVVLSNGTYHQYVKVDPIREEVEEEVQDQELHRIQ